MAVDLASLKRKPAQEAVSKGSSHADARRLAEIFPRMMGALSQLTHAEEMIHKHLTASQLKVLSILGMADGPKRMSELAKDLGITQASLTETAKKLHAQGYISRQRKADDDRVVHVSLTPQGHEQVLDIERKVYGFFQLVCDGLNPKDRKNLVASHEFIYKTYMDAVLRPER